MKQKLTSRTSKTLVLSSGKTFATLGTIALAMVLSRLFTKAEWATYRQTFLIFTMISPLLGMGLSRALLFFMPVEPERTRGILIENLVPILVSGFVYLLFIVLGGNQLIASLFDNPALETTLLIMAPIAIFRLTTTCVGPCMIATNNIVWAAIFNSVSRIALVGTVLITVYFVPTVFGALWSYIIVLSLVFVAALYLMLSICTKGTPTLKGIKPQLAYGLPLGLSSMVGIFSRNIDRTMVSSHCSLEDYAVFENGALELPLVGVITKSMTSILLVDYRAMISEEGRLGEILPLLHRAMIKSCSVLIPTMVLLLCVAPEFMVCMFGEKYRESASVFRVYLLLLPVRTVSFSSIGLAAGKTKSLAIVPLVTIIANVILNYFALIYFGYIGCAVATVFVIYFVSAFGRALIAQRVLNCSLGDFVPWKQFATLTFFAAISAPVVLLVRNSIPVEYDLGRLAASTLVYGILTMLIFTRLGYVEPKKILAKVNSFRKS